MPTCDKCKSEVDRLTLEPVSGKQMCIKCIALGPKYMLADEEVLSGEERRNSIRIPLTLSIDYVLAKDEKSTELRFPATTIDISTTGVCFTWDSCTSCPGHTGGPITEDCIFYPFYYHNPLRKSLRLEMKVSELHTMTVDSYAVYMAREAIVEREYMGVQFFDLTNQNRRILEKLLIKFG